MSIATAFLTSYIKRISYYKELADKTFEQLSEADFHFQPNEVSNSIAIIIQHMAGNMKSRFTNFLTEDGEKEWRNRDTEFEEQQLSKEELLKKWEDGWACVMNAINQLTEDDLLKTISIRSEELTVMDALNRQMAHYPYHVGQIVFIGRMIKNKEWLSLSIPKGASDEFNRQMKK
ncbi:DinB family protein [Lacibacter sp. H407]|uniref:DinB family protein n=1 Tax=Lacibacter sp. H407 TaxID=3133423 RepID=UPI0030BA943E